MSHLIFLAAWCNKSALQSTEEKQEINPPQWNFLTLYNKSFVKAKQQLLTELLKSWSHGHRVHECENCGKTYIHIHSTKIPSNQRFTKALVKRWFE